jgi:virginiamycin B lyase
VAAALLLGALPFVADAAGSGPSVTTYSSGLTAGGGPNAITLGPDHAMWFTEYNADRIGRIAADGTIAEYGNQMSAGAHPSGIAAAGSDLFFGEFGTGRIGELDTGTGQLVGEYAIPTSGSGPDGLALGSDGGVWFAEQNTDETVGRIDPGTHAITEYDLAASDQTDYKPTGVASGPDGAIWVTLLDTGQVARIDPTAASAGTNDGVTIYDLPSGAAAEPEGIVAGADGDLYVAEYGSDAIARIVPSATAAGTSDGITEYPVSAAPLLGTSAGDGGVWFTEPHANALVRLDPQTDTTTSVTTANGVAGEPTGIADDGDGHLWFTEFTAPAIGTLTEPSTTVTPPTTTTPTPPTPPSALLVTRRAGTGVAFDGSQSVAHGSAIAGYKVTLTDGAGTTSINCGAGAPVAVPQFSHSVAGTATLTVTAANGTSSSTSVPFSATGLPTLHHGRAKGQAKAHDARVILPQVIAFQCLSPSGTAAPGSAVAGTAPGTTISSSCQLNAGIIQVDGCGLQKVSDLCSGVPSAERAIVEAHLLPGKLLDSRLACGGSSPIFTPAVARPAASAAAVNLSAIDSKLANLTDSFYVSSQPVRINGIDVTPRDGSSIVIAVGGVITTSFAEQYGVYLIGSNASEGLGGFALKSGKLDVDVSDLGAAQATFASFSIKNPITFGRFSQLAVGAAFAAEGGVPSLPLTGGFDAVFIQGGQTRLDFNLQVNNLFNNPLNDAPFTGSTSLLTDNDDGLILNGLDVNIPDLDLDIVDLSNIKFHWDRATNNISGQIGVGIDDLGGAIGGTFAFQGADFLNGGVFYQADEIDTDGGGGYLITPPIYLIGLSATFSLYQPQVPGSTTSFDGQADLSVGPAISNNGCGLLQANGDVHMTFYPGPFSLQLIGTNEILCIPLEQSYFSANSDGYAEVGGDTEFDVPGLFDAKMNLDGQAYVDANNPGASHFQLDGNATATLDLPNPIGDVTLGGQAVLSDLGAGICGDVDIFGYHFHPGITESFTPTPPFTPAQFLAQLSLAGDGCDLSPYQPLGAGGPPTGVTPAAVHANADASAHAAAYGFTVPQGEATATVMLRGSGAPPSVTLHGPGGRTIDTAQDGAGNGYLVLRQDSTGTTLAELAGANAGRWTITIDPDSAPVLSAATAHELPTPHITAHVTGTGAHRVLHYRLTPQPGLQVRFVENGHRGGELIGVAHGRSGSISFVPSMAAAGPRTISAVLTENGLPRPGFVVAHYRAAPPRPGAVSRITAIRRGAALLIRFRAAPLATSYAISLILSDGRELLLPSAHTVLRVPGIGTAKVTRLSVIALRDGELGPRIQARLTNPARRKPAKH